MAETITFIITGIVFGFTAGISPGPLLTVVITETITYGRAEGFKVAIAPLLTDIPIILLTIFVLSKLDGYDSILGIVSLTGGLFIIYLAVESFKAKEIHIDNPKVKPYSLRRGIIVNTMNPHPYIFWMTIGVPLLFKSYNIGLSTTLAFILSFYALLVGSKVIVAILTDKSRNFIKNRNYIRVMRILGIVLLVFAAIFIRDGLKYFRFL